MAQHQTRVHSGSNDTDAVFDAYVSARSDEAGPGEVLDWACRLSDGASILDLGCGHGIPLGRGLRRAGFEVFGIDSSPWMVAEFQRQLPGAAVHCTPIQDPDFFGRAFDGVVAWGVMFLLSRADQALVIAKVAHALNPRGSFLFTAPRPAAEWEDTLGGRDFSSVSLGVERYTEILNRNALRLIELRSDPWGNDYYVAERETSR